MAQVICTSKHGQFHKEIGGVKFFSSPAGRISEEISDEKAEEFLATPNYFTRHMGDPIDPPVAKVAAKAPAPAQAQAKATASKPASEPAPGNPNF